MYLPFRKAINLLVIFLRMWGAIVRKINVERIIVNAFCLRRNAVKVVDALIVKMLREPSTKRRKSLTMN